MFIFDFSDTLISFYRSYFLVLIYCTCAIKCMQQHQQVFNLNIDNVVSTLELVRSTIHMTSEYMTNTLYCQSLKRSRFQILFHHVGVGSWHTMVLESYVCAASIPFRIRKIL